MRPPGEAESQREGKFGLASIVCGAGSFAAMVLGCVPLLGLLAAPLAILSSLAAIVLGVVAIVDASKRGDSSERLRGITGLVLGLVWPVLAGLFVLVFSDNIRKLFEMSSHSHIGPSVVRDAGTGDDGGPY